MNSTPLPHGEHTCNTCQVSLRSFDAIRSHYGSELHLLNVKKRVCGDRSTLPTNTVSSTATTVSRFFCSLCKKTFHCARTLQDHVLSKGHKLAKAQAMEQRSERLSSKSEHQAMETSDGDQDAARISQQQEKETETVTVLHCFFCSHTFQTLDQNLNHMQRKHHFVLPHPEHLKDKEGLLQYLVRKINGYLCIVCAEHTKEFSNLRALQRHMLHTGHTCLELTEEYEEFYHPKLFEEQRQKNEPFEIVITQRGRELMRCGTVVATDSNAARCLDGMTTDGEILIQRPHCSAFDLLPQRVTRGSMLSICDRVAHHHAVEQQKKQVRDCRKDVAALNKQWMNVGVKMNKLHPKGYDGEGKV